MDRELKIIGYIKSTISDRDKAPKQGCEGGVEAVLELKEEFAEGLDGLQPGSQIIILSWFHKSERHVLKVHPRANQNRPKRGVFSTRSPDRPNPIGLHPVTITEIDGLKIKVQPLEAIDGTPIVDIKNADRRLDGTV